MLIFFLFEFIMCLVLLSFLLSCSLMIEDVNIFIFVENVIVIKVINILICREYLKLRVLERCI